MAEHGRDHLPLRDVVLCSTSLPQEARTRLVELAKQMGAEHALDLTGEVTHLIVGDSNTPKYKYVAKERPDIIVLDPTWIDAVREAWIDGGDVDVQGLERIHRCPTFTGLKICITGTTDQAERNRLASTVEHEGAEYHGDLTKQVTHLIVFQPGSAKHKAAQDWRIHTVSTKWLEDSSARGMALDPKFYDPTMPYQEQGKGAYRKEAAIRTSLGKRLRNEESQTSATSASKRKLRRHASRRLEDHSQDMWQDISAADVSTVAPSETTDQWTAGDGDEDSQLTMGRAVAQPQVKQSFGVRQEDNATVASKPEGLFSGWCIATEGFDKGKANRLAQYLEPNGAYIVKGLQNLNAMGEDEKRCILVPHAQTDQNMTSPNVATGIIIATEWWVERCIHYKQVLDPQQDVLSQPLWNLNILGLSKLTISTTGFSGVDYRQVAESIKLAGATYQEQLTPTISLLISGTPAVKKEKAYYAAKHQIPVVTADWLWTCLEKKRKPTMDRFKIELPKYDPNNATGSASAAHSPAPSETSKRSAETGLKKGNQALSRLSHTRKRQATPSLPLQTLKPNTKTSKPAGPFVHEDDDEDEDEDNERNDDDFAAPVQVEDMSPTDDTSTKVVPLKAISPNASPRKPRIDQQKVTPPTEEHDTSEPINTVENSELQADNQEAPSPSSPTGDTPATFEGPPSPERLQTDWTANLASIMERQQRRTASSEHPNPAQRLKHRKLGRAASGSSLASRTNTGSSTVNNNNPELRHGDTSFSDSSESLAAVQENLPALPLPSTQVGYETLEAEAARMQMAKRMGTSYEDESSGTRLASLGTVRDSAAPGSATGGRSRNRARK